MKLAIDNQISNNTVEELRKHHDIVILAQNLADADWITYGLEEGAEVFISPDLDVPNYLQQYGSDAKWLDIPQGLKSQKQFEFIMRNLK